MVMGYANVYQMVLGFDDESYGRIGDIYISGGSPQGSNLKVQETWLETSCCFGGAFNEKINESLTASSIVKHGQLLLSRFGK